MTTLELINEVKSLIEDELSIVDDNEIYKSYKARNISNYSQALRALMEVKRIEEREENYAKQNSYTG